METRFLEIDAKPIFVRTWNEGTDLPVVVMVHGLVVSSRYMVRLGDALSDHYKVFAPDLPGHGYSHMPKPYLTTAELGDALNAVMAALDLHDVTVVANSYGGPIVTEAAVADSSRLSSLVLIGPATDEVVQSRWPMVGRFVRSLWREPLWALWATILDIGQCGVWRGLHEGTEMVTHRIHQRLPLVDVPVHFIRGEHDHVAPQAWLQSLSDRVGGGPVTVIRRAAHEPQAKQPTAVAAVIRAFRPPMGHNRENE